VPGGPGELVHALVDQEVSALLATAEPRARDLLTSQKEALTRLTAARLDQETITGDQVRALVRAAGATPLPGGTPAAANPPAG
jgi:ATP-dependent Zn protease